MSPKSSSAASPRTGGRPRWRKRLWPRRATRSKRPARKEIRDAQHAQAPMAGRGDRRLGLRTTKFLSDQALLYVGAGVADVHYRQRHVHHLYRGRGWRTERWREAGHRAVHDLLADRRAPLELLVDDLRRALRNGAVGAVGGNDRVH